MAHDAIIASLVDTAKAQFTQVLDAIVGEADPFKVATAFLAAKAIVANLESLVVAVNDPRFAPILTGAFRAQADQSQSIEALAQDPEAEG